MPTVAEMVVIVAEIDRALDDKIRWEACDKTLAEHSAVTYHGETLQNDGGGWQFLLVEYPVDERGTQAVMGTATRLATVVMLPTELAKKALGKARGGTHGRL